MIYLTKYENGIPIGPMNTLAVSNDTTVSMSGVVGLRKALGDRLTPFTARSNWTDYIEWMSMPAAAATLRSDVETSTEDDLTHRDAPVGVIYKGARDLRAGVREHLAFVSLGEAAMSIPTPHEVPVGSVDLRYTAGGLSIADLSYRSYAGGYLNLSGQVQPLADGSARDAMQGVWEDLGLDMNVELPSPPQTLVIAEHAVGDGHLQALHQYLASMS